MKPLYIFDLDGTLADCSHRLHFIQGEKKDWPAFFAACVDDKPKHEVIEVMLALEAGGADIWIWSGRSDEVYQETARWLSWHCKRHHLFNNVRMRAKGDHSHDYKLKRGWLDGLSDWDRRRLVAAFEDRDRMVEMYRSAGVTCFQVAPGGF